MRIAHLIPVLALLGCEANDVDALNSDVADLQAQLDTLNAELAAKDERIVVLEGLAGIDGTLAQDIASNTEALESLQAEDGPLADVTAQAAANAATLEAQQTTLDGHTATLDTHGTRLDNAETTLTDHTSRLETLRVDVDAAAADIDTNTTAIADNAASIGDNTTTIIANTSAIATNASGVAANRSSAATNATAIRDLDADLDAAISDIEDNAALLDESFAGGYPALYTPIADYAGTGGRPGPKTTNNGLLMQTVEGAFYLGGGNSVSGQVSYYFHDVTFYVRNPTTSDKTFTLTMCGSDENWVVLDGRTVFTSGDDDTRCALRPSLTLTPGSHTVRLRVRDNNIIESIGIRNNWITDNGLELDWAEMKKAMTGSI